MTDGLRVAVPMGRYRRKREGGAQRHCDERPAAVICADWQKANGDDA